MPLHPPRRPAHTLAELVLVVAIAGMATVLVLRQSHRWLDHLATHAAVSEAALVVERARNEAMARHTLVTLRVDTSAGTIVLQARGERLATHALSHQHGVHLAATRDSITFDVRGLGYGAANMSLVVRRGEAAETLVVSRLGRTRY